MVAALLDSDRQEPFWSTCTLRFAAAGLAIYFVCLPLFAKENVALTVLLSIARLTPLIFLSGGRKTWLVTLATPYPFELVLLSYSYRLSWMPEWWYMNTSSPTGFLIYNAGLVLISLLLTSVILANTALRAADDHLRRLAVVLFLITALSVSYPQPELASNLMRYVADPVAMIGFAAIYGWSRRSARK